MEKRSEYQKKVFRQIWNRFNANVGSLLAFGNEGAYFADQQDQDLIRKKSKEIANLFDDDPVEVEREMNRFIPSLDSIEIEPLYLEDADTRTVFESIKNGEFQRSAKRWYQQNPRKGWKLIEVLNSMFEELPANGILLRRGVLIILVSFLEQLFLDLFTAYSTITPASGPATVGTSITVPDPDIDLTEAQKQAKKNIEGGIEARIKRLEGLGVNCSLLSPFQNEILEINRRRNLFVHKDGVIDQQYLDHIPPDEAKAKGFGVGRRLVVSTAYLHRAIDVITIYGLLLHQQCWRKWGKEKSVRMDKAFNDFLFNALRRDRYDLVKLLAGSFDKIPLDQQHRKYVKANYGIALRETGDLEQLKKVIVELKRSRPDAIVKISIAILSQDYSQAHRILFDLAKRQPKKFRMISKEWPLFNPIKEEDWFCRLFDFGIGELPHES